MFCQCWILSAYETILKNQTGNDTIGLLMNFRRERVDSFKFLAAASSLLLASTASIDIAKAQTMNPVSTAEPVFLQKWTGPYEGVPPWDKVVVSDFPAAFQAAMASSKAEFEAMLTAKGPVTFENTISATELSGQKIDRLFSIWGVHSSNLSTPEIRKIQAEWEPKVSAFFSELQLDDRYFARVKDLYDRRAALNLDAKQMRLLERTYDGLVRNGALLDAAKKAQVVAVETALSKKFSEFSEKVLADEEKFILLSGEADLAGLPESYVASLKAAATEKKNRQGGLSSTHGRPFSLFWKIQPVVICARRSGRLLSSAAIMAMRAIRARL